MTQIHGHKFGPMAFQSGRRKVQRRLMTALFVCGILLIVFYVFIVIGTGLYVLYAQYSSDRPVFQLHQQLNFQQDPIVKLLASDEENLNKYNPQYGYDDNGDVRHPIDVELAIQRLMGMKRVLRRERVMRQKRSTDKFTEQTLPEQPKCSEQAMHHVPNKSHDEDDLFPEDLFTLDQRRKGAIVFHFCGLCYMFVALAIVCDEFFVPSLGVLTERLAISDDVAGATFMAAGGSAPEFFTSVFGVFITENNVGVGTVVGSATFNILFVLAFCCLFSREVLHLTWWPLFRDILFYVIALVLLLIFFYDEKVDVYEASTLFGLYIIYGVFMKFNARIEGVVKRVFFGGRIGPSPQMVKPEDQAPSNGNMLARLSGSLVSPRGAERTIPLLHSGAMFRTGIVQMALDGLQEGSDTSSMPDISAVTPPRNETARRRVHRTKSQPSIAPASLELQKRMRKNSTGVRRSTVDLDQLSVISGVSSIWSTADLGHARAGSSQSNAPIQPTVQLKKEEMEQPVDISWPNTFSKRCIYITLAPIMLPLYFTLADVKKPERKKWFAWTFVGSILWIAFYAYLMVWWANVIGTTIGIPNEIMGLTVLAAGTSIPDLITSILVARKGLGDMAVSSSIGSNLFDVCVGLPFPWLLKFSFDYLFLDTYKTIPVVSNGLICAIGMLFSMLMVLYVTIAITGWKMSKSFGFTMLASYFAFCVLSVLLEINIVVCPLRRLSHHC